MTLRESLNQSIDELKKDVVAMADLALSNIKQSIEAFRTNNIELAKVIITKDDQVDYYEEMIAKKCLSIIWREQPLAKDLRLVTGILKLITDIERIGDHATDISEIVIHVSHVKTKRLIPMTIKMFETVEQMVLNSIQALIKVDSNLANSVIEDDDIVDKAFNDIVLKMVQLLKENKTDEHYVIYVLMLAKYIERIGDHAVNIAEWIIYIASGIHKNTQLF